MKQIAPRSAAAVKQAFDAASAPAAGTDGLNPGETVSVSVGELFDVLATDSTVAYLGLLVRPVGNRGLGGSAAVRVTARVNGAAVAVPQSRADEAAGHRHRPAAAGHLDRGPAAVGGRGRCSRARTRGCG